MPFISYAQNYEDVILWRALRDVEKGYYVDVGAADPQVDSVTCAFYERGWSGINIEPLDEHFIKLTQARPRDTNLKVAVGQGSGRAGAACFPRNGSFYAGCENRGATPERRLFGLRDFGAGADAAQRYLRIARQPIIHFLKIDVEGAEAEVLEGLNLGTDPSLDHCHRSE